MMRILNWIMVLLIAVLTLSILSATSTAGDPFERTLHKITLADEATLRELAALRLDIVRASVDGGASVEAYLNADEVNLLIALGYQVESIPNQAYEMFLKLKTETEGTDDPMREYHSYEEMVSELQAIADAHPDLCELYNIGPTVQGRALWFMKISDNVAIEEDELEFKYIASMHGDEVVGKEMCMYLINYLVDEYGINQEITDLVNETEIWIMPSMNPDGTAMGIRYNASGVDLNRDFPDRVSDPINTTAGRAIETADVMNWNFVHQPVFSANFHCGALVANYPWDNCWDPQANAFYTDNQDVVFAASETYSWYNQPMWNNNYGPFTNGVVNGVAWYIIDGGMQDWNYHWMGDMDITMEISEVMWPPASTLPGYWEDNRQSMIEYMKFTHRGIRGIVTDAVSGLPLLAEVLVPDRPDHTTYTDPDVGDYHRVLMPGVYDLDITCFGYWPGHLYDVEVQEGDPVRMDVALQPANLMTFTGTLHNPAGGGLSARLILRDTPYNPVETNVSGEFSFSNVYEGEYILRIINMSDGSVLDFPITLSMGMAPLELWGPISIFYDGFEAGLTSWSAQGTWGTSGNAYTGALSAADSPGGNYGNNLNISLTNTSAFDLSDYDYVTLSYNITCNCETNYDTLFSEISENGSIWEKINCHNSKQDWWTLEVCDISQYAGNPNLLFRYRLKTDGSVTRDGGFIDEVRLAVASTTPLTQAVTITLTPYGTPIQIPLTGGNFSYNIAGTNNSSTPVATQVWCDVTLPSGGQFGPVLGPASVTMPAGASIDRDRNQSVPGGAPAGEYTYHAYLGDYPNNILAEDSFTFEKLETDGSEMGEWFNDGEDFETLEIEAAILPEEPILSQNYPNPFNPVTKIHFALPISGQVRLTVYNVAGQLVELLVDGYRKAGWHEVTWNASNLATGLYIYRLEANNGTYSQKAILVK